MAIESSTLNDEFNELLNRLNVQLTADDVNRSLRETATPTTKSEFSELFNLTASLPAKAIDRAHKSVAREEKNIDHGIDMPVLTDVRFTTAPQGKVGGKKDRVKNKSASRVARSTKLTKRSTAATAAAAAATTTVPVALCANANVTKATTSVGDEPAAVSAKVKKSKKSMASRNERVSASKRKANDDYSETSNGATAKRKKSSSDRRRSLNANRGTRSKREVATVATIDTKSANTVAMEKTAAAAAAAGQSIGRTTAAAAAGKTVSRGGKGQLLQPSTHAFDSSKRHDTFHTFVHLLHEYEQVPRDDRMDMSRGMLHFFDDRQRRFCCGEVYRRYARDTFRFFAYSTNRNADRLRSLTEQVLREYGVIYREKSIKYTDQYMIKHLDYWYDFASADDCGWRNVTLFEVENMLNTGEPIASRCCRVCAHALLTLCKHGLCLELYRYAEKFNLLETITPSPGPTSTEKENAAVVVQPTVTTGNQSETPLDIAAGRNSLVAPARNSTRPTSIHTQATTNNSLQAVDDSSSSGSDMSYDSEDDDDDDDDLVEVPSFARTETYGSTTTTTTTEQNASGATTGVAQVSLFP